MYRLPEYDEISLLLTGARDRLGAARCLYDRGYFEDAVNRAYYAMFFATKAALLKKNIITKTHRGLIRAFGTEFVQKGLISPEFGKMLHIAEELREEVDYSVSRTLSKDEVTALLENAEEFIDEISSYLTKGT